LYSISAKFKINEKSFQPITSLGKILRSLDFNLKNIPGIPYNPLDKKMNEILRLEKNQTEEGDATTDINKKFQMYNFEIFQFRKNSILKQIEATPPIEESKSIFTDKNSSSLKPWTALKSPTIHDKNVTPNQIVTMADEKKDETIIDNSLKLQSLAKTAALENPASSYQLGFNLFEVKNYDKKTFNNDNMTVENVMHKTSSQNDFFKTSLQLPPVQRCPPHNEDSKKQKIHSHFRYLCLILSKINFFKGSMEKFQTRIKGSYHHTSIFEEKT